MNTYRVWDWQKNLVFIAIGDDGKDKAVAYCFRRSLRLYTEDYKVLDIDGPAVYGEWN